MVDIACVFKSQSHSIILCLDITIIATDVGRVNFALNLCEFLGTFILFYFISDIQQNKKKICNFVFRPQVRVWRRQGHSYEQEGEYGILPQCGKDQIVMLNLFITCNLTIFGGHSIRSIDDVQQICHLSKIYQRNFEFSLPA